MALDKMTFDRLTKENSAQTPIAEQQINHDIQIHNMSF
jgi:hypothetical protein